MDEVPEDPGTVTAMTAYFSHNSRQKHFVLTFVPFAQMGSAIGKMRSVFDQIRCTFGLALCI